MKNALAILLVAIVLLVYIGFLLVIKLLANPAVTVGGLAPFSWENLRETLLMLAGAAVVVALVQIVKSTKDDR